MVSEITKIVHCKKCINCKKELNSKAKWKNTKRCKSCEMKRRHKIGKFLGKNAPNYKGGLPRCKCGKILSDYKTIRCQKCYHKIRKERIKGSNNWNWRGGISKLPYSFEFTNNLKELIRKRDDYQCQLCDKTQNKELKEIKRKLSVHHIDYNKDNCKEGNLISLCSKCNSKVNYNRKRWINYFKNE